VLLGFVVSVEVVPGALPVSDGLPGIGVWLPVLSGTVDGTELGFEGCGLVLLPPFGVCSLIGWLPVLDWPLCEDCATANVADNNAIVAIEANFFMVFLSLGTFEWRQ